MAPLSFAGPDHRVLRSNNRCGIFKEHGCELIKLHKPKIVMHIAK
jgi:hypothetical protein